MTETRLLRVRFAWPPALEAARLREMLASTLEPASANETRASAVVAASVHASPAGASRADASAAHASPARDARHDRAARWTLGRGTIDAVGCAWLSDKAPALPTVTQVQRALESVVGSVEVAALRALLDVRGASEGRPAPFRYAVETDVAPELEADFNAWYDREHLAGLAAVPGTVRAARFRDDHGHPRYLALYDLEREDVLGSPPWLAVRATAWSSRMRPAFRNTRRILYRQS
jgi:hypothetical protein